MRCAFLFAHFFHFYQQTARRSPRDIPFHSHSPSRRSASARFPDSTEAGPLLFCFLSAHKNLPAAKTQAPRLQTFKASHTLPPKNSGLYPKAASLQLRASHQQLLRGRRGTDKPRVSENLRNTLPSASTRGRHTPRSRVWPSRFARKPASVPRRLRRSGAHFRQFCPKKARLPSSSLVPEYFPLHARPCRSRRKKTESLTGTTHLDPPDKKADTFAQNKDVRIFPNRHVPYTKNAPAERPAQERSTPHSETFRMQSTAKSAEKTAKW